MELTHEFTVPARVEETWAALDNIASVGECFPGAVVTSAEGDTFAGTVKVKLGPIALVYHGTGTFVDKDESGRIMRIRAKGKDKRGNGTAGADVVATLVPEGEASTRVTVHTDLSITGKPAQFGRGVIQDVSDKLLGQFVECLAGKVGQGVDGAVPGPARQAAAEPGAEPGAGPGAPAAPAAAGAAAGASEPRRTPAAGGDGVLDLGAALVPALLRSHGRQVVTVLAAVLTLRWLRGRRR